MAVVVVVCACVHTLKSPLGFHVTHRKLRHRDTERLPTDVTAEIGWRPGGNPDEAAVRGLGK